MRTELNIVVVQDTDGSLTIYCNDPDARVHFTQEAGVDVCGCCGRYHLKEFSGDCRDDDQRFTEVGSCGGPAARQVKPYKRKAKHGG
jgi:hypothetical protein